MRVVDDGGKPRAWYARVMLDNGEVITYSVDWEERPTKCNWLALATADNELRDSVEPGVRVPWPLMAGAIILMLCVLALLL